MDVKKKPSNGMATLRNQLRKIEGTFVNDRITEEDVMNHKEAFAPGAEGRSVLIEKVEKLNEMATHVERLKICRSAGDVFLEFAPDAAAGKIVEMISAATSENRQRAQESVLEYALGKPINRSMTMTMNIPTAREEEIDNDIRRLMAELGYASGEGTTSQIIVGTKGIEGYIEAGEVDTQSGIPGEIQEEQGEG